METQLPSSGQPEPPGNQRKLTAFFLLLILAIGAGVWELTKVTTQLHGRGVAIILIGNLIVGLFVIFLLSILISAILTYAVRRGLLAPRPGSLLDRLVSFWSGLIPPLDIAVEDADKIGDVAQEMWSKEFTVVDVDAMLAFMTTQKGRGRKSYTRDDYRFHAVRDWISMQMKGTSVRLQDFLDERFGYQQDGSPQVPKDTFYGWYKKFKKMLTDYKSDQMT